MWLQIRAGSDEGRVVRVVGERFVVGRDDDCDLILSDERVSRNHAFFKAYPDGRAELHDLGSSNGTIVNGQRIQGPVLLQGNEQVQFGDTVMTTSMEEPADKATVMGAVPVGYGEYDKGGQERASAIERRKLRRGNRIAIAVGAVAVVAAVVVGILFATGVIGGDGGSDQPSVADVVDTLRPSVFIVNSLDAQGQGLGNGTGWVLDEQQGLIVTNGHVVMPGSKWSVVGEDGRTRSATLFAVAPCDDIAIVKVTDTAGLKAIPLTTQANLRQGESVVVLGYPGSASSDSPLQVTEGVVSAVRTRFDVPGFDIPNYPNLVQTTAPINPGNSGGPLVTLNGELAGINSASITQLGGRTIQGEGYAIGVDRVKEVTDQLRAGKSIGWTGAFFDYSVDTSNNSSLGLPSSSGIVVTRAEPGSPAATAGFGSRPVLITSVNGVSQDGTLPPYCRGINSRGSAGESAVFSVVPQGSSTPTDVRVNFK